MRCVGFFKPKQRISDFCRPYLERPGNSLSAKPFLVNRYLKTKWCIEHLHSCTHVSSSHANLLKQKTSLRRKRVELVHDWFGTPIWPPFYCLRTVPTFVSHGLSARAGVDIDAINYATKCTTKIKANFSYCDQINFNESKLIISKK